MSQPSWFATCLLCKSVQDLNLSVENSSGCAWLGSMNFRNLLKASSDIAGKTFGKSEDANRQSVLAIAFSVTDMLCQT